MEISGTITALVTPFCKDGSIDWPRLAALVDEQVAAGIAGLVPVGTSGESPTLNMEEHGKVIAFVTERVAGRTKIIAGTGGNSTSEAMHLTREAKEMGVDATLQVCPYYNKPSQEGLYRHYMEVAGIGLPIVLYNVPGRTGREIAVDTIARLSKNSGIVAVKEAAGSVTRVSAILDACDITVLCGDDMLTLPMVSVGAKGVISVASNVMPREMCELTAAALRGDMAHARAIHKRLYRLFRDLFIDTNPVPVKAALAMMGKIEEVYRLPLCELTAADSAKLRATLAELSLV
ncbi:MAG: 4-hydroxy-tetrahydrodipicolinate synthase [Kiritimatiellae bacterium]|jgi:4-hydroxy-tetrahydrodipicolinate synthase|nr:4-hydroxy-tetrahydrodipicolinate synthase [Kiritimatiellia bacterium]